MPVSDSGYVSPAWLPGGNLQTIVPAELFPRPKVQYRREIWATPDDDIIAVDWCETNKLSSDSPVMVHFHGLEGSSKSHYAEALMAFCAENGIRGLVIHYRGCGGIDNKKLRAYCAADVPELSWIFKKVRSMFPLSKIYSMGVSLGANNLLFWLGTLGEEATKYVDAAVAVCCPMDLMESSKVISKGFSRVYDMNFINTMKDKALKKALAFPGTLDPEKIKSIKNLHDFDDFVTAPMFGYKNADDYWTKCSSSRVLKGIRVPVLAMNALNDPIVGKKSLPMESEVSKQVTLEYTQDGGHCGYPLGPFPGSLGYLPKRTWEFCTSFH